MSDINDLKKDSVIPFIKLLETNGLLHSERFVGLGIHVDKLYLLKEHARPERVVISDHAFAFLNKKADGPAFNIRNGQTREEAAQAYAFHGKDAGGFTEFMMIPESEMQRVLMISSLRKVLESVEAGDKPDLEQVVQHMFTEFADHPGMVDMVMEQDPSVTREEVEVGMDLLSEAIAGMATGNAQPQQPRDFTADQQQHQEQAQATPEPEPEPAPRKDAPKANKVIRGPWPIMGVGLNANRRLFEAFGWA